VRHQDECYRGPWSSPPSSRDTQTVLKSLLTCGRRPWISRRPSQFRWTSRRPLGYPADVHPKIRSEDASLLRVQWHSQPVDGPPSCGRAVVCGAKSRKKGSRERWGGGGEAGGAVVAAGMEYAGSATRISETNRPGQGGRTAGGGVPEPEELWQALRRSEPAASAGTEKARMHRLTGSPGALKRVLRLYPNAGAARDEARVPLRPVLPRLWGPHTRKRH